MSEKVKVSKNEAKAIEAVSERIEKSQIIAVHVRYPNQWDKQDIVTSLNGMPLDTIIRALYIGYEVEQTPEDKVREYIEGRRKEMNSFVEETSSHNRAKYRYDGAMTVAEILGIKIEGVNA